MRLREAIDLLAGSDVASLGVTQWADLGCGTGTFTQALAAWLAPGSTVHAIDRDASALRKIPPVQNNVRITTHRGDFAQQPWPFDHLDGILMANSLHYIDNQAAFVRACTARMTTQHRFLIVEYDTDEPNRWVPYPLSQARLRALFARAGYSSITVLNSRPSIYRSAPLFAALICGPDSSARRQ